MIFSVNYWFIAVKFGNVNVQILIEKIQIKKILEFHNYALLPMFANFWIVIDRNMVCKEIWLALHHNMACIAIAIKDGYREILAEMAWI